MVDVTVVVATYGNDEWERMGDEAMISAFYTNAKNIVRHHIEKGTVSQARNEALKSVETRYVTFLDADDDLSPDYFDYMSGNADVIATSIDYNYSGKAIIPKVWTHEKGRKHYHEGPCSSQCLYDGNWVHVGAIIKTDSIRLIGGFKEYPVYEDWALFLEMKNKGMTFSSSPQSVYHASVRNTPGHRNQSMPLHEKNLIHQKIYEDITGKEFIA